MTINNSVFVLDANVFIEAARRYYAFDLVPGFWESLLKHATEGAITSIDRIKHELERGQDDLADWVGANFGNAFASTNEISVTESFGQVMIWVHAQSQFSDAAKAEFADGADGWLVGYAKTNDLTVVTHEVLAPDAKRKVPIPNVCQAFDVPFLDTFEMLRKLGVRLG